MKTRESRPTREAANRTGQGLNDSVDPATDTIAEPRLTGCPCGCKTKPPFLDDWQCARHRRLSLESARSAWRHLQAHHLVDDDGLIERVLREAVTTV